MTTVLDTTGEAERAVLAATFIASSVVDRLILDHALEPDDDIRPDLFGKPGLQRPKIVMRARQHRVEPGLVW